LTASEVVFDIDNKEKEIKELEKCSLKEDFWGDPEKAGKVLKKNSVGCCC
jgi:hypothetical protein